MYVYFKYVCDFNNLIVFMISNIHTLSFLLIEIKNEVYPVYE